MGCKACQKPKVHYRKGLWSPEEDQKLRDFILRYGHGCWSAVPVKAGKTTVPSSACDDFAGEFTANFATAARLNALHLCPASKPPCLLVAALVFFFFFSNAPWFKGRGEGIFFCFLLFAKCCSASGRQMKPVWAFVFFRQMYLVWWAEFSSEFAFHAGLQRNGKSCRLRWINYLRPGLKHGMFSREEEETVMNLHATMGNK